MILKKIRKHGSTNITFTGELGNTRVNVVFEEGVTPIEGVIKVTNGKVITKGDLNYYYVKSYVEVDSEKDNLC